MKNRIITFNLGDARELSISIAMSQSHESTARLNAELTLQAIDLPHQLLEHLSLVQVDTPSWGDCAGTRCGGGV